MSTTVKTGSVNRMLPWLDRLALSPKSRARKAAASGIAFLQHDKASVAAGEAAASVVYEITASAGCDPVATSTGTMVVFLSLDAPKKLLTFMDADRPDSLKAVRFSLSEMPKDRLVSATYHQPSGVRLQFSDGLVEIRTFAQLDLDMTNMKVASIRASSDGTAMEVASRWNEIVDIDASSLRALVDKEYAVELENALVAIRGPLDQIVITAKRQQ